MGGFQRTAAVGFNLPACLRVALGLAVCAFAGARLRRLDRCWVNDVYSTLRHDDALCLKLTIDLTQQDFP